MLEPLRGDITIYSGLSHRLPQGPRTFQRGSVPDRARANIGGHGPYKNSISVDQVIASMPARTLGMLHWCCQRTEASAALACTDAIVQPRRASHPGDEQAEADFRYAVCDQRERRPRPLGSQQICPGSTARQHPVVGKVAVQARPANAETVSRRLWRDPEVKLAKKLQKWIDTPIPCLSTPADSIWKPRRPKGATYFQTMYELIYLAFLSDSTALPPSSSGRENGEGPHDLLSQRRAWWRLTA